MSVQAGRDFAIVLRGPSSPVELYHRKFHD